MCLGSNGEEFGSSTNRYDTKMMASVGGVRLWEHRSGPSQCPKYQRCNHLRSSLMVHLQFRLWHTA